ncbi:DUF1129 domain-containing protein [Lacticaseibacillus jixiensis]|uniref:DUF1129 domain-containing protein n=1 Tax=Lacticaseibacillus jixiensis TaxID=3231926 RepID=UPI0036F1ED38
MADKKNTPEEVQPEVDVEALLSELTKKNDEYVFKLRRILKEHQYTDAQEHKVLVDILPEMVEAQRTGKPATQIYGPVTVKADSIINAPKPRPHVSLWLSGLDLSLLFASIFGLMYGIMGYFKPKAVQTSSGLASVIVMAVMAGYIFAYYNDWARQPKGKRTKTWLITVGAFAAILLGSFLSTGLSQIKSPITSPAPWQAYAVMTVVGYGAHWLLKRRYKLPGLMAAQ